jgi:hypothetical protein
MRRILHPIGGVDSNFEKADPAVVHGLANAPFQGGERGRRPRLDLDEDHLVNLALAQTVEDDEVDGRSEKARVPGIELEAG